MSTSTSTNAAPAMLADAYEELRQAATGIPGTGRSLRGRVILIRQGMAAWIRALMEAVASEATTVSAPPTLDGVRVAAGMQREVVELLATMALTATSTEVRT